VGSPSSSKFAILGVPEKYDLDAEELERRYRELSRAVHPDRFATAPPAERLRSLSQATALNDAYKTLRSPVARAVHLLELRGSKIGDKEPIGQDFLMEILELREELAAARAGGDEARVRAMEEGMRARHRGAMARIADLFAGSGSLDDVKHELIALRYFQRFLDEVEGNEEDAA
jgi:molecular chaperone HscB